MTKYYMTVTKDTYFKNSKIQETLLAENEKILFNKGETLVLQEKPKKDGDYFFVVLGGYLPFEGYFFKDHVTFQDSKETEYKLKMGDKPSWFKKSTKQSFELPPESKRFVEAETELFLTKPGRKVGTHTKVHLANPSAIDSTFSEGYFYTDHLESVDLEPEPPQQDDFERVIQHILRWEGGCSNHPNDPGGRTYMGITTERARLNGWYKDVCTMPKSMVLEIYKKDYWLTRPHKFPWPLNLAVMNTEVNSGGGRAQQFLDRMYANNVQGTIKEKASWFVDQQTAFYRYLVNRNPKQYGVFLRGWLNRSNYMQKIIKEP